MGFHALGVIFGGTAVDGTWDGRCIAHSSGQEDTTAGNWTAGLSMPCGE